MAEEKSDGASRSEEATPKRIEDARSEMARGYNKAIGDYTQIARDAEAKAVAARRSASLKRAQKGDHDA